MKDDAIESVEMKDQPSQEGEAEVLLEDTESRKPGEDDEVEVSPGDKYWVLKCVRDN